MIDKPLGVVDFSLTTFIEGTIGLPQEFVALVVGPILLLLTITLYPGGIGQQIAPVRRVAARRPLRPARRQGRGGDGHRCPCLRSATCPSTSAASRRCSTSTCAPASGRSSASSARTAPARPRCSTASPASTRRPRARCATAAATSAGCRCTSAPRSASAAPSRTSAWSRTPPSLENLRTAQHLQVGYDAGRRRSSALPATFDEERRHLRPRRSRSSSCSSLADVARRPGRRPALRRAQAPRDRGRARHRPGPAAARRARLGHGAGGGRTRSATCCWRCAGSSR